MRPEAFILTLLLKKPRSVEEIRRITRYRTSFIERVLTVLQEQGLVEYCDGVWRLTKNGKLIALNTLAAYYRQPQKIAQG